MAQKLKSTIQMRRTIYVGLGLILVSVALAAVGFVLAIGGGALGIILYWIANVLGLVAGVLTLIGVLSTSLRRWLSVALSATGFLVVGVSLLVGITAVKRQISNPMRQLNNDSKIRDYSSTRIECRYGTALFTIDDPHNQIRFRFGEAPSSVEVHGDLRVIRFVDTSVTLKSFHDGISIYSQGVTVGGWMGASSSLARSAFTVDHRGYLQATNQADVDNGQPETNKVIEK